MSQGREVVDPNRAVDALSQYVACVFEATDIVNLRFIHHGTDHVPNFFTVASELPTKTVAKCLDFNSRGYSIYAGANPRTRKGGTTGADVALARCLFTEWDGVSLDEARMRWTEAEFPEPTLVLFSGAGPHAYWRLTEPLPDLEVWTDLQKRLVAVLGSDNIHDLPRVMRLPGFINRKPDRGQLVTLLAADPARRYRLRDLAAVLPALDSMDGLSDDDELPDTSGWKTEDDASAKGLKPGQDFNQRGDMRAVLLRNGWTLVRKERGNIERWRRPGKSYGVSASLKDGKVLFCFTTASSIPTSLPTKRGYTAFAVLTYLEYGGDFSACAKALAHQGYGDKSKSKAALPVLLQQPFKTFPVDALPALCAKFVRQASESIDCDESMIALPLIGSLSAAIGNSCRIQLKDDYSEPAVVWAAIVCESGTRKSAALEAPLKAIRKRELVERRKHNDLLSGYTTEMAQYKVALNEWQKRGHKDGAPPPTEPEKPVCRRFTVSDVTAEGLAMRLEQNPRGLLLIRDELAGFFTGLNQYKANGRGADEAAFLAMHGAKPLVIDRKNPDKPSIYVWMAFLSIIGTIQPGILRRLWTRERMEAGMGARFLIAYPPPRAVRWREKSVERHVEDRIATMFDFLLDLRMETDEETNEPSPVMLPLTPEARELWIPFHDAHCSEQIELEGDLSAAWAKLTGYAARLALIIELASWACSDEWERPRSISAASMQSGITLARWFADETRRVYAIMSETDEQKGLRWLVDYIRQRGSVMTARDLSRGPRRYRDCVDLAEARLDQLVRSGMGDWEHVQTSDQGGRPTRRFRLKETPRGDETPANAGENQGSVAVASADEHENGEAEWTG